MDVPPLSFGCGAIRALHAHAMLYLPFSANDAARAIISEIPGLRKRIASRTLPNGTNVALSDFGMDFWRGYCRNARLPVPERMFMALPAFRCGQRAAFSIRLRDEILAKTDSPVELAAVKTLSDSQRKKSEECWTARMIESIASVPKCTVLDQASMLLLAASSIQEIAARSQREGVVICHAGSHTLLFALVFRGAVYGIFEVPAERVFSVGFDAFLPLLEDFRLGWLPVEKAKTLDGEVACLSRLPPEAEGFKPLFVIGKQAEKFSGRAHILGQNEDARWLACHGLFAVSS